MKANVQMQNQTGKYDLLIFVLWSKNKLSLHYVCHWLLNIVGITDSNLLPKLLQLLHLADIHNSLILKFRTILNFNKIPL